MRIDVIYHVGADSHGDLTLWADSPHLPGYTATATTLSRLRSIMTEGIGLLHGPDCVATEAMDPPDWLHAEYGEIKMILLPVSTT